MSVSSSKREFLASEAASLLRQELQHMVDDPAFNTQVRYSTLTVSESDFIAKHMEYMATHLKMNHQHYVSNLRLMTRVTPSGNK